MMRRHAPYHFLLATVLAAVVVLLGWSALLAGQLGQPVAMNQWVEQSYARKLALADALTGPRALIVAGSGALFGLDSAVLGEALGRPVINLGVNAGIQSQYLRHYAYQAIRPGDWVVLPLEYPLYHDRHRANLVFSSYWLSHPGIRSLELSPVQLARLFWFTSLGRVLEGYRGLPEGFHVEGLYGPHNFNERGDQVNSEAARQEIWMHEAVSGAAAHDYGAQASAWHANWDHWRAFRQVVEARGGCVLFIPPALLDRPQYHVGDELDYYRRLPDEARAEGLNFWGEPLAFMYPEAWFFDTDYHLNAEARQEHSRRVARLLVEAVASCPAN